MTVLTKKYKWVKEAKHNKKYIWYKHSMRQVSEILRMLFCLIWVLVTWIYHQVVKTLLSVLLWYVIILHEYYSSVNNWQKRQSWLKMQIKGNGMHYRHDCSCPVSTFIPLGRHRNKTKIQISQTWTSSSFEIVNT